MNLKIFKLIKKENTKMYKILRYTRRYNSKSFTSYEDARKYVRRLVTKITGTYHDDYTQFGFTISN